MANSLSNYPALSAPTKAVRLQRADRSTHGVNNPVPLFTALHAEAWVIVQFAVGRDAALRRPRPRRADGNPSTREISALIAPLNAARSSQRDDPTARIQLTTTEAWALLRASGSNSLWCCPDFSSQLSSSLIKMFLNWSRLGGLFHLPSRLLP